jgi:homoserine O-acetyltransferase/O-succinyltransferase
MAALLTYRSRNSFEAKFGRNIPDPSRQQNINGPQNSPSRSQNRHWAIHNDGHKNAGSPRPSRVNSFASRQSPSAPSQVAAAETTTIVPDPEFKGQAESFITPPSSAIGLEKKPTPTYFSAQSYLRYQGEKFVKRFDANCYIAISRKLDTHDISRGRDEDLAPDASPEECLQVALARIEQPTLILGIESDGLFTFDEQLELAAGISNSRLEKIDSSEGHDAFLLEFEQVNAHLIEFMNEVLPDIMGKEPELETDAVEAEKEALAEGGHMVSEVDDITAW